MQRKKFTIQISTINFLNKSFSIKRVKLKKYIQLKEW